MRKAMISRRPEKKSATGTPKAVTIAEAVPFFLQIANQERWVRFLNKERVQLYLIKTIALFKGQEWAGKSCENNNYLVKSV